MNNIFNVASVKLVMEIFILYCDTFPLLFNYHINSSGMLFSLYFLAEGVTKSLLISSAYHLLDQKICISQPDTRKMVGSNSKLASGSSTGLTGGVLSTT